ncbi:MAG: hypothetical protein Q9199_007606, partial [Rusavskia elegans]
MTGIAGATETDYIPIAQLDLTTTASLKTVQGIVTLIWPYSVSSQSFSILLAEPDFRLRRQRGQVRVQFRGSSAKALAKCDVQSGDLVKLSLVNAQWERDETASGTPGRGIGWELRFDERVVLQIQRENQEPINLDIDHPAPSPERRIRSPPPLDSSLQSQFPSTPVVFPAVPSRLQAWSTPAFLKRDRLSGNSYFGSDYDPFDEDDFRDNSRRKKTKYGRASNQWRFTEQESSPESATGSKSPATEPLAVNGAQNGAVEDQARNTDLQVLGDNRTGSYEKQAEDPLTSHGHLVDAGVQVDNGLTNQLTAEPRLHDGLTSPVVAPQSQIPTTKHHYPPSDPGETENLRISESVEVTMNTTTPVNKAIPSMSLDIGSPDQGVDNIGNNGAAYSPQLSQGKPRSASPRSLSQDGQRNLVELNAAAEEHKSAESQEFPKFKAGEGDLLPWIPGKSFEESVNERPSQDERSPSPVLENDGTRKIREDSESAVQVRSPQEPQKPQAPRFSSPNTAQDDLEKESAITELEGAQHLMSPPQEPLPKVLDQVDRGMPQESIQAVPESYITETQTVSLVENSHSRSTSPTRYNVKMVSPDQDARSVLEDLESSSQPHNSLSEQPVTISAQSSQNDIVLEDDKAQRDMFVESDPEEDAQAQSPSPDMLDVSDNEGEEVSEEDLMMDDESRRYQASERSDEGQSLYESEAEEYYQDNVPNMDASDEEPEDAQEAKKQEMSAPQPSSAVQIITIDDSDEDDVDVARSQTDGAIMSILHNTRQDIHTIDSLLPKQKGGSPIHSSPPLPDTIPDSQAAAEVGELDSDMESAAAEIKEGNGSSPSISRSVPNSDFREGSEDFADGAEITARSLTASLSPEIPLETYIDPRLKNKVITPNDTQPREGFSQASHVWSQSFRKSHNLPTPQLTQNRSSDILLPASLRPSSPSARSSSPTAPMAESSPASHDNESSAPIDQDLDSPRPKVQDGGKAFTALKPSPKSRRVSNIPPSLSPWFAPRRSSEVVPDSRSQSPDKSGESDASSSEEIADIEDIEEQEEQEEKDEEE